MKFLLGQWVPLGLPVPIPWGPTSAADNLVVDFTIWNVADMGSVTPGASGYCMWSRASTTGTINRAFLRGWTMSTSSPARVDNNGIKLGFLLNDGNFVAHGGGCPGSNGLPPTIGTLAGSWPQVNGALIVELRDGPANSAAFLSIGTGIRSIGAVPLPIDLAPVGAPGCYLWHDVLVTTGSLLIDPSGYTIFTLGVPNSSGLVGARLFTTWLCLDPAANNLGFTSSGYATAIIGT